MNAQPMFLPPALNVLLEEMVKDAGAHKEVRAALKTSAAENAAQHQAYTDYAWGLFDCLRVILSTMPSPLRLSPGGGDEPANSSEARQQSTPRSGSTVPSRGRMAGFVPACVGTGVPAR